LIRVCWVSFGVLMSFGFILARGYGLVLGTMRRGGWLLFLLSFYWEWFLLLCGFFSLSCYSGGFKLLV